nr:pentapeptide repeat-containing protein [uncultured Desulfobacter sp.]
MDYTGLLLSFIVLSSLLGFVFAAQKKHNKPNDKKWIKDWRYFERFFHYSGITFIFRKFFPAKQSDKCPTGFIWLIGLYFAAYAFTNQRYENELDKVEFQYNIFTTQVAAGAKFSNRRLMIILNEDIPERPVIYKPMTIWKSFLYDPDHCKHFYNANKNTDQKYYENAQTFRQEIISQWDRKLEGADFKNAVELQEADFSKAMLKGADFGKAELEEADFIEARLEGADFRGAMLHRTYFWKAKLVDAHFGGRKLLKETDFWGAVLKEAHFETARLKEANFRGAILESAHFVDSTLEDADFENAQLKETHFGWAKLIKTNFRGATLKRTNFKKAKLIGVDFGGAQIEEVDFEEAEVERAHFKGACLEKADFWKATLKEADFGEARLNEAHFGEALLKGAHFKDAERADFWGAQLEGAHFESARLNKANFWKAQLEGAHFEEAMLEGACFWRAKLEGAHLEGALLKGVKDLTAKQLIQADSIYKIRNCPQDILEEIKKYDCTEMLEKSPSQWPKQFIQHRKNLISQWAKDQSK